MTESRASGVEGFVLVGGRSRRFGSDKARHRIGGLPACDVLARRLEEVCTGGVRLVGREEVKWSAFVSVPDATADRGPLGGVSTALDLAVSTIAVVVATDLWNVASDTVAALVHEVEQGDDVDLACAMTPSGRMQPLCAAWRPGSCRDVVRARLESGDVSMHGAVGSLRTSFVIVEDSVLLNVNDRADLDVFLGDSSEQR